MLSVELSEIKEKQKLRRTSLSDSLHFNTVCCFQCVLLVTSVMLSIYAKLFSLVLALREREREREREAINMQGTVFTLARLKIVPTTKNLICRCHLYDCEM